MAQVLIFNMTDRSVSVMVNQGPVGRLGGADPGNRYLPTPPLAVERGDQGRGPGRFGNDGPNEVMVVEEGGSVPRSFGVAIPPHTHPAMDLRLYLFSGHALFAAGRSESVQAMSGD